MKYALAVVGIALACSCGRVADKVVDAPVGVDADIDGPPVDACTPAVETLDGKDNDCDGQIDNGFWATVITTPLSALAARDAKCSDEAAVRSNAYECQLAARRECQARHYDAGLRPADVDATNVSFTCVADIHITSAVSYAELSTYIPTCNAGTAFDTPCFAAIKRYCQNKGFKTGIGPFNVDTDASIDLLCTDHAGYLGTTVDELHKKFPNCNMPTTKSSDFVCFNAYHHYCQMMGWDSGWGPVEFDGTNVFMACLNTRPRS